MSEKDTNPKDLCGGKKMALHLWPMAASVVGSLALLDGMLRYGRSNWRVAGVRASVYYDALQRHIGKWLEGADTDEDSGLPHLGHALACLAILVDAQAAGKLVDDRLVAGGTIQLLADLTPHVARLKALHAAKNPRHYTIKDNTEEDRTCTPVGAQEDAQTVIAGTSPIQRDPGLVAHDAKRNIESAIESGGRDLTTGSTARTACAPSLKGTSGEPDVPVAPRSTVPGRHGILDGTCNEDGVPDVEHRSVQGGIAASAAALSGQGTQGTPKEKESTVGAAPVVDVKSRSSWLFRKSLRA